jgi:hypothetical protein
MKKYDISNKGKVNLEYEDTRKIYWHNKTLDLLTKNNTHLGKFNEKILPWQYVEKLLKERKYIIKHKDQWKKGLNEEHFE